MGHYIVHKNKVFTECQVFGLMPWDKVLFEKVSVNNGSHFYTVLYSKWPNKLVTNNPRLKHDTTASLLTPKKVRSVDYPVCMGSEVISIQNGGGSNRKRQMTSSLRRAHGVRTKVGRLRKHSLLKSDWFSVKLVILTCRKNKY